MLRVQLAIALNIYKERSFGDACAVRAQAAMTHFDRRVFVRSIAIGVIITSAVLGCAAVGLLDSLENWLYDQRAIHCQLSEPPPTTRFVHLDIDNASQDAVGRWPWPRGTLARIFDEVQRAHPAAVALDIMLSEPQPPRLVQDAQGKVAKIDDDAELARVIRQSGKVVLATSFKLEPGETQSSLFNAAVGWFTGDLELSEDDFEKRLADHGWTHMNSADIGDLFLGARRQAMKDRIDRQLDTAPATADTLLSRLLPHTDPDIASPLIDLLKTEYADSLKAHSIYRFGAPSQTLALPPVQGTFDVLPATAFSSAAASCAFANYDIFDTPTLRNVPLFAEYNHRLYPQLGLAAACIVLGADPARVRFEGANVVIPAPGGPITIPTFTYHSKTLGRDVPLIAAIPWFGKRDWETMYDWPDHKTNANHLSIARVWDICMFVERVAKNSASIDAAISDILDDDQEYKLRLDPDLAKKYAASLPGPQDVDAREAMAKMTLKNLADSGWLEQYRQTPDSELKPNEKFQKQKLFAANDALQKLTPQNRQLHELIDSQRRWLAGQISGKGVLIGWIAEGYQDAVSTSLYRNCPGVVVHGVIANAVLTGRWWHFAPTWVNLLLTLFLGIATAAALGWLPPVRGSLLALAILVDYLLLNGLVFFGEKRWIVGLAEPAVAITAVWAACVLYRLIIERIERSRIAMEVAVISAEMELARQVQVALIPTSPPKVTGLEADGWAQTASVTGGDCYDLWELRDGRLAVLLADASGHGLAPAMVVSQLRTLVRALCEFESHPHELLGKVNSRLASDLQATRFVTVFLGFLSPDGKLDWTSAGHGPIYWRPEKHDDLKELDPAGMPLGIQDDWTTDSPPAPLQLGSTGMLAVFSDGIFEAPGANGEQFGVDRIKEILIRGRDENCIQIISAIRSAVQHWQGKVEPIDDQTIVVLRKTTNGLPPR